MRGASSNTTSTTSRTTASSATFRSCCRPSARWCCAKADAEVQASARISGIDLGRKAREAWVDSHSGAWASLKILYHHRIGSKDGQAVHMDELIHAFEQLGHEVLVVGPKSFANASFGHDPTFVNTLKRAIPQFTY